MIEKPGDGVFSQEEQRKLAERKFFGDEMDFESEPVGSHAFDAVLDKVGEYLDNNGRGPIDNPPVQNTDIKQPYTFEFFKRTEERNELYKYTASIAEYLIKTTYLILLL